MTNAEKIRSMTDEELAKYLPVGDCFCCPVLTTTNYPQDDCDACAIRWLKSEAEE